MKTHTGRVVSVSVLAILACGAVALFGPAQAAPVCPAGSGPFSPALSQTEGPPGASVVISGSVPLFGKDGTTYVPTDEVQVWWNLDPDRWESALLPEPASHHGGPTALVGRDAVADPCSYSISFRVPDVPAGWYTVVVLNFGGGGAAPFEPASFRVTETG